VDGSGVSPEAANAGTGAARGALTNAASQELQTGKIDPKGVVEGGLTGGATSFIPAIDTSSALTADQSAQFLGTSGGDFSATTAPAGTATSGLQDVSNVYQATPVSADTVDPNSPDYYSNDPSNTALVNYGGTLQDPTSFQAPSLPAPAQGDLVGAAASAGGADASGSAASVATEPGILDKAGSAIGNAASGIGNYLSKPGNAATAGLLGLSALRGLTPAPVTPAAKQLNSQAGTANAFAQPILANGGAPTPAQLQTIQDQFSQQLQQGTEAILQTAANSGQGGANSMVVQQQIAQLKQQLTTQMEAAIQAQTTANVNAALSALTGSNQALSQVANAQMGSNQQNNQLASGIAQNTLLLSTLARQQSGTPTAAATDTSGS
jgi:hypothetical protein